MKNQHKRVWPLLTVSIGLLVGMLVKLVLKLMGPWLAPLTLLGLLGLLGAWLLRPLYGVDGLPGNVIVSIMYKRRVDEINPALFKLALILAVSNLAIFFVSSFLFKILQDYVFKYFICSCLVFVLTALLLWLKVFLLKYRIQKGYYANNEYEAIEIINFIIQSAEKNDFTDSDGKPKKIFDQAEEKNTVIVPNTVGEQTA